MAWRIGENVVRGEIDNRLPGIIRGTLHLEGLNEPLTLELEGNCSPDLAGRHLTFRNLMPLAGVGLEALSRVQCGDAGTMTGNCMVRIPTISPEEVDRCIKERKPIPTRWSESLYLEWFSKNGRMLIEGAGFACKLSPAKWKLSEEAHEWLWRLKERRACDLLDEDSESSVIECSDETEAPRDEIDRRFAFRIEKLNGLKPHPLVQRLSEFWLQMILESKSRKFYADDAIENQPLEAMIEATNRANIRLARAMATATRDSAGFECDEIVDGLKQARWSLAEAAQNAGFARHMAVADVEWLTQLCREFSEMRQEIRCLILEYDEQKPQPSPAVDTTPNATTS